MMQIFRKTRTLNYFIAIAVIYFFALYWYPMTIIGRGYGFGTDVPIAYKVLRFIPFLLILFWSRYNRKRIIGLFFGLGLYALSLLVTLSFSNAIFIVLVYLVATSFLIDTLFRMINIRWQDLVKHLQIINILFFLSYLIQIFFKTVQGPHGDRFVGTLGGPNLAGGILGMFSILWLLLSIKDPRHKKTHQVLFGLDLFLIAASTSMGSILSTVFVLMLIYLRNVRRILIAFCSLSAVFSIIAFSQFELISLLGNFRIYQRFLHLSQFFYTGSTDSFSMNSRIIDFDRIIMNSTSSVWSFIFGTGGGWHESFYLHVFSEIGVFGLLAFMLLLLFIFRNPHIWVIWVPFIQMLVVPVISMFPYAFFILLLYELERKIRNTSQESFI
jgi:hypothetical protein